MKGNKILSRISVSLSVSLQCLAENTCASRQLSRSSRWQDEATPWRTNWLWWRPRSIGMSRWLYCIFHNGNQSFAIFCANSKSLLVPIQVILYQHLCLVLPHPLNFRFVALNPHYFLCFIVEIPSTLTCDRVLSKWLWGSCFHKHTRYIEIIILPIWYHMQSRRQDCHAPNVVIRVFARAKKPNHPRDLVI